jgi:hypothetical protein
MPLSAPAPREPIHTRRIECQGFRRADGLWDVEGHLTDVKTYGFRNEQGDVLPGMPVHEMWLRVTFDDRLVIQAIEAVTDASPFRICPEITPNFQRLVGLRVGSGLREAIRERVGGTEGCTHLAELMGPIATTAFQTIVPFKEREEYERAKAGLQASEGKKPRRPPVIDTCHALASDGAVVKRRWPAFYTGS